jgi:hypothetical protein
VKKEGLRRACQEVLFGRDHKKRNSKDRVEKQVYIFFLGSLMIYSHVPGFMHLQSVSQSFSITSSCYSTTEATSKLRTYIKTGRCLSIILHIYLAPRRQINANAASAESDLLSSCAKQHRHQPCIIGGLDVTAVALRLK